MSIHAPQIYSRFSIKTAYEVALLGWGERSYVFAVRTVFVIPIRFAAVCPGFRRINANLNSNRDRCAASGGALQVIRAVDDAGTILHVHHAKAATLLRFMAFGLFIKAFAIIDDAHDHTPPL